MPFNVREIPVIQKVTFPGVKHIHGIEFINMDTSLPYLSMQSVNVCVYIIGTDMQSERERKRERERERGRGEREGERRETYVCSLVYLSLSLPTIYKGRDTTV